MSTSDGPGPPMDRPDGGSARGADRDRAWRREVGEQLGATRREGERHAEHLSRLARQVGELVDEVSQLLPRVDSLDIAVAGLATPGAQASDPDTGPGAGDGGGGVSSGPAATPATRWTQLSRHDRSEAWDALARWVAEVLNGEYRLSRVALPDCWPVHPRAVRELAWLRTLHVATTTGPPPRPETVAEWHTRWLPAAVANLSAAIDARECAPGRHRLTEEERRQHHDALTTAADNGGQAPELTGERGADRPRYYPDRMPLRRSYDNDPLRPDRANRPRALDEETPPPPSTPDDWWEYFLDARMADIGTDRDQ